MRWAIARPLGAGLLLAVAATVGHPLPGLPGAPLAGGAPAAGLGSASVLADARSVAPAATEDQALAGTKSGPRLVAAAAAGRAPAVALPGGHGNYVVAMMGGGRNAYWVRLAEYQFAAGPTGAVTQWYWTWSEASFRGGATANKVPSGYVTSGCSVGCIVRTPRGFQRGANPATIHGSYHFDSLGHVVIRWSDGRSEAWAVARQGAGSAELTLHHSSYRALYGDALGSDASFSAGASRNTIARLDVAGTAHTAVYCAGGTAGCNNGYVHAGRWNLDFRTYNACRDAQCLFVRVPTAWRSALAIDPATVGRRVYWEHENAGVDGYWGTCFSSGGGHTWAALQAVDDDGRFIGLVAVEASLNARVDANAVVSEVVLKPVG